MTKRALSAVAGFVGLCVPLFAQQTPGTASIQLDTFALKQLGWVSEMSSSAIGQPDIFRTLNQSIFISPSLMLSNGELFSFSNGWASMEITPSITLPTIIVKAPQNATAWTAPAADSSKEVVNVRRTNPFDYVHGEVGFLYGSSSGKFGGNFEQGYIIGDVGNDKLHISVGASYENSSGRIPRLGR
ncbi:MAG: hypothetical protein M3R29_04710 [Verrucomicrobiota bacterium]|nr:hypothetical protein [Verrucomicrobiota bacterium]